MNETVTGRPVRFPAGSLQLSGVLRTPSPSAAPPWPALLLTGPFTGVKEQVVCGYAQALTARGFVTLAFDHRNFGASDGTVRQHEDSAGKIEDLRAATSYLMAQPEVDNRRVGCLGICLGGGYALRHSAFDPRIGAVAAVAGAFNDPTAFRQAMGVPAYRAAMAGFARAEQQQFTTGEIDYLPAVTEYEGEAAMAGEEPWAYYGTSRSASPGWVNQVTRLSLRELLTFDAAGAADFLDPTPLLVVHGRTDGFCSPEAALATYERASGPKELLWLETSNHIDLYDQPRFVDPAVARVADWMRTHL